MEMEMEMEMRAVEATPLSSDLTPPIPPISVALHDKYLASRCTICFRPLSNPSSATTTLFDAYTISLMHSCSACSARVKYCSPNCFAADSNGHVSSGECRLFFLLGSTAEDSTDLRAALRLLHSFERLGILPSPSRRRESSGRIGGLLVTGLIEIMEEAGEMAERIREGAALMARARHPENFGDFPQEKVSVEEEMLWAVMLNGVEVEIGELGAVGVAVYGPWFSWFNHSCVPNACYRFDMSPHREVLQPEGLGSFKVFPACSGSQGSHVWKMRNFVDSSIVPGLCWFGPRIIIRSIKPLNKNEEVCITYMDLLQPKAMRHLDLWSRYHFTCHCKRCCISPQMYIDFILDEQNICFLSQKTPFRTLLITSSQELRSLNCGNFNFTESEAFEAADFLEEAIAEYMLDGNSENCCRKMEKMLSDNFHCNPNLGVGEVLEPRFCLHPIHYLSLKAYIVLFSAYRVQAVDFNSTYLNKDEVSNRFKMARGAAAYSLLAAGATHHLFMSERSIISNTAVFWVNAGESILYLARNITSQHQLGGSRNNCALLDSKFASAYECRSQEDLLLVSAQFLKDVSCVVKTLWRYLVEGFSYLECIENPVDFSWLRIGGSHLSYTLDRDETRWCMDRFCGSKYAEGNGILENYALYQLAVHCLTYGGFLANICYGSGCHLFRKVRELLDGIR